MTSNVPTKNIEKNCNICIETYKDTLFVCCPFCAFEACRECCKRYIMDLVDDKPRCMSPECKKVWSFEFISQNFTKRFSNKTYRDRRAQLAYERERALMPGTQPLVQSRKELEKKRKDVDDKIKIIRMNLQKERSRLFKIETEAEQSIRKLSNTLKPNNTQPEEKKEAEIFTRACPVEKCRGFLSSVLKCGVCSIWACKDCHLPKKGRNDPEHVCNPDTVATIKLLTNDTKPCPSCATPIYKISGCDQMFCTTCHTPFSWKKGTIETGVIHNPHYYAWQRKLNGGNTVRRDVPMRCGGPPSIFDLRRQYHFYINWCKIHKHLPEVFGGNTYRYIERVHRIINHINQYELREVYQIHIGHSDNTELRVDYLTNAIDEKKLKSELKKRMKKQEKDNEFHMVLSNFSGTMVDVLGNILNGEIKTFPTYISSIQKLRVYTNSELKKVGDRYGNIYPYITNNFEIERNSKNVLEKNL